MIHSSVVILSPGGEDALLFPIIAAHALAFLIGLAIIVGTLVSAVRTFVVPRSISDWLIACRCQWIARFSATNPQFWGAERHTGVH